MKHIVCRCEDTTTLEIETAIDHGYADIETLKRHTGFGTGYCQGKMCLHLVATLLMNKQPEGRPPLPFTPRPLVDPTAFSKLALLKPENADTQLGLNESSSNPSS